MAAAVGVEAPKCVDVLCDRSGNVGTLSYLVPDGMDVQPGDAVRVPFGKRTKHGVVVGPGDAKKATRPVEAVFGRRSSPADLQIARSIARFHFCDVSKVYPRLAPTSGKGADPARPGQVRLVSDDEPRIHHREAIDDARLVLLPAPLVDTAQLAATQAARLSGHGQVLVLCPTTASVTEVLARFKSGACRLDGKAAPGAWKGFGSGTVPVGVGTRSSALYSTANLAGIIVVDEHHPGHVEQRQPHTHARDVASARARQTGAQLIVISPWPSPQALWTSATSTVGSPTDWPRMQTIDLRDVDPFERHLPSRARRAIRASFRDTGVRPVVVVPSGPAQRRCRRCGEVRPCGECTSSLCRHRDTEPCPNCASIDGTVMRGWDVERMQGLLRDDADVVTPTELHTRSGAKLVVVTALDRSMHSPQLLPEKSAGLLVLAAARAAGPAGQVVALTEHPGDPLVADLFRHRDLATPARRRVAEAREAALPPFGRLVTVKVGRKKRPDVSGWPGKVLGPRKTPDGWEILVCIPPGRLLDLAPHVQRLRRPGKVTLTVA